MPFADEWNNKIGAISWLWANTYDIVPYAFQNVKYIKSLYGDVKPAGPSFPVLMIPAIDGFINTLALQKKPYKQPGRNQFWMPSYLVPAKPDSKDKWSYQVGAQHFPPQYYRLMCAQFVSGQKRVFGTLVYIGKANIL